MSSSRAVTHARRTGGLAIAAGETAVEMCERVHRHRIAFEHLLDEVDAPARPVEFIAQQLVSRAGGVAETAVHAAAQYPVGLRRYGAAQPT